jgi:hypothetical protein
MKCKWCGAEVDWISGASIEDLGGKEHEAAMGTARTGRNANGHIITAPEMVAEDGSR